MSIIDVYTSTLEKWISAALANLPSSLSLSPLPHRNGQAVEGSDHATVVSLIRNSGREVNLVVVSVSEEEARRLEPDGSSSGSMSAMDYFERRSVPVSVPDTRKAKDSGKEYVLFNIYMANKHMISRRYREFDALNSNVSLREERGREGD